MRRRVLVAAVWVALACAGVSAWGQGSRPAIDKIDPPDWFAGMPSPMLLVHGTGLEDARFAGAPVTRTVTSPNGHWAMVWLDTQALPASTLHLTARGAGGEARFDYVLRPRRGGGGGMAGFSAADVMVCIMPDRFADGDVTNDNVPGSPPADRRVPRAYHGGDLKGVIDHLDYLRELGITAVWLTPILANDPAGRDYHGYGATDMYAVDPRLGSVAEYARLGVELHRRGMKLIFDDVPNHVGPANVWVKDPPLPDWFHGTGAQHTEASFEFDPIVDPHAPERDRSLQLNGWFVNTLPDMNQGNPVVAQYLTQNMIWWIEKAGIDGLRIDTFPYVQRSFWGRYLADLAAVYPKLSAVGEVSGNDPVNNAFFAGGRDVAGPDGTFDTHLGTPFDYPIYWALRDVLSGGKPFTELERVLREDWIYPHPERLVTFIGNHDQTRFLSLPNATPALLRIGLGLTMTMRGMPELYIGDEIGMLGGEDPDNRRDFPGGFPGDAANAFLPAGRTAEQAALHDWVVSLGRLRAGFPVLQGGAQEDVLVEGDVFVYVRARAAGAACAPGGEGSVLVAVNRAPHPATFAIRTDGTVLAGCSGVKQVLGETATSNGLTLTLPATSFTAYNVR